MLLVILLILARYACADGEGLPKCNRLQVPLQYVEDTRSMFNPAAVFDAKHGWTIFFRHDQCAACQYWDHHTSVLASYLNHAQLSRKEFRRVSQSLNSLQLEFPVDLVNDTKFFIEDYRQVSRLNGWHSSLSCMLSIVSMDLQLRNCSVSIPDLQGVSQFAHVIVLPLSRHPFGPEKKQQ